MTKPWFLNLVLLAAIVAAAARFAGTLGEGPLPLPTPPEPPRVAVPESPPPPTSGAESYQAIVEKNLFSPDRGKPKPAAPEPAAVELPKAVQPPKATLFGVIVDSEGVRYAFLTDETRGVDRPRKYREGDEFSGGRIKEIRADRVVLAVGSSEFTLPLRAPKQGIEPPATQALRALPSPPPAAAAVPRTPPRPTLRRSYPGRAGIPGASARPPASLRRTRVRVSPPAQPEGYEEYSEPGDEGPYQYEEEPYPGYEEYPEDEGGYPEEMESQDYGGEGEW